MRMADIMAFTILLTEDLTHTGKIWQWGGLHVDPLAPSLCYWTLDQFTSVQDSMTSEGCPKTDCKKKKKKQTTFFPGCCFSASHFLEGGKVIKGFRLEKAFYFNSYWAGVNKDVVKVNNNVINQSRWQCQEELESKSPLCYRVIKLDYK